MASPTTTRTPGHAPGSDACDDRERASPDHRPGAARSVASGPSERVEASEPSAARHVSRPLRRSQGGVDPTRPPKTWSAAQATKTTMSATRRQPPQQPSRYASAPSLRRRSAPIRSSPIPIHPWNQDPTARLEGHAPCIIGGNRGEDGTVDNLRIQSTSKPGRTGAASLAPWASGWPCPSTRKARGAGNAGPQRDELARTLAQ